MQPVLPNSHLPKQSKADSGITKIIVNPTQVGNHQSHPAERVVEMAESAGLMMTMAAGIEGVGSFRGQLLQITR